jgi:hypothetical protein
VLALVYFAWPASFAHERTDTRPVDRPEAGAQQIPPR